MSFYKSQLVGFLLSFLIIVTISSYFIQYKPLEDFITLIVGFSVIVVAFSLPIGGINIIKYHLSYINTRKKEWYLSVWLLFCIALVSIVGVFLGTNQPVYSWIYQNVNLPSGAAIYAITSFFIATAMFRAFRVRNIDASLLMICCVIVMLMNAPIGALIWGPIVPIGTWLSNYVQNTGVRVIWVGVAIGFVALSIRYIFGKERTVTGGRE